MRVTHDPLKSSLLQRSEYNGTGIYMLDGPIWAWRRLYLKTSENHTKTVILTALNMLTSNVLFYN